MTGRFNLPGQSRPTLPMTYFNEGNMGGMEMSTTTFGTMEENFPPGITFARQSRRLYVGGFPEDATEEVISGFFNEKMREMAWLLMTRLMFRVNIQLSIFNSTRKRIMHSSR